MTFFTLGGTHHDFAISEVGKQAPGTTREAVGLSHIAFKIGDDIELLKQAKAELDAEGIHNGAADHGVSKSLYFADPDSNASNSMSTSLTRGSTTRRPSSPTRR